MYAWLAKIGQEKDITGPHNTGKYGTGIREADRNGGRIQDSGKDCTGKNGRGKITLGKKEKAPLK